MIDMLSFRILCGHAIGGQRKRVLFILPTAAQRHVCLLDMQNIANKLPLTCIYYPKLRTLVVGDCEAVICIAHERLDQEMRAQEFTSIDGMVHLDKYENSDDIKLNLLDRLVARIQHDIP